MDVEGEIRRELRASADPARAPGQQAYMKSTMPFLGVRVPEVRRIARAAGRPLSDPTTIRDTARRLWDSAEFREEWYAAMALLGLRPIRGDLANVPLIEHLVRTGQWWDITDELAHRLAELHDNHPEPAADLVLAWCRDDDLWIRRIAILSQLGRRDRLDRVLLASTIEPNLADPDFFIRKAIGWALREYARVDPTWVRTYAEDHPLSPLSRREALKHLTTLTSPEDPPMTTRTATIATVTTTPASSAASRGFRLIRAGAGTTLRPGTEASTDELRPFEILVEAGAALDLRIETELGAAAGYWHPEAGEYRTLPPDWAAQTSTSLVCGAPVGCLYDAAGNSLFSWALDELVDELEIRYGVSEEHKTFALELHAQARPAEHRLTLLAGTEQVPVAEMTSRLATWLAERLETPALPVPAVARRPVYSTWYTFTQDLDQASVEAEIALGTRLGLGSVFIDDGWQQLAFGRGYSGCGDWVPDTDKFPDLAGFSARVQELGAGVVLWVAPLLLGPDSAVFSSLAECAPVWVDRLRCHVLDPRHRRVREHLAATCVRLVVDYDLAGLKIDFLDDAMVYRGTPSPGDLDDVGQAMQALLALVRTELAAVGRSDLAIEFRQPYVSPAIAAYGQILRAADCPGDAVVNRRRTVDSRLLAVGQVVHSDMLMWGPTGGAEAVAQQLYGCWFSVPQISMRLADLAAEQTEALAALLELWQQLAPVTLDGSLSVQGVERCYDLVQASRSDLGRRVIGRYVPAVIDLETAGEVTILNATAADVVTVRVADGLGISSGLARTASAGRAAQVGTLSSGLHDIDVPPFGSLTLSVSAGPSGP